MISNNQFGWQCYIDSDRRYGIDQVRLVIMQRNITDRSTNVMMSDGTWENVPENERFPESPERTVGIIFPADTINAFIDAIKEFKGNALEPTTEVKVLREWLALEQQRTTSFIKDTMDLVRRKLLDGT